MFGLKKKKEEPKPREAELQAQEQPEEQSAAHKAFAAQFLPEETDILAVTAPAAMGQGRLGESELWRITIGLTAWMDEYTRELRQGDGRLEAVVDDKLLEYLSVHVPRNFIISVTVRPSEDGARFLMTDLPKPGFDPELKAILEAQKRPVTLEAEGLGTFTLNRGLGWFEATVDWMGAGVSLTLDQAEESLSDAQDTARALMDGQEEWDGRVRAYLAEQLLDRVNELAGEDGDSEPLTREELLAQLELDSILAGPGGAFDFWFGGDGLFLEHPVHVTGTLAHGPTLAELDG